MAITDMALKAQQHRFRQAIQRLEDEEGLAVCDEAIAAWNRYRIDTLYASDTVITGHTRLTEPQLVMFLLLLREVYHTTRRES